MEFSRVLLSFKLPGNYWKAHTLSMTAPLFFFNLWQNLRAIMYGLAITDRYEVKRIAGRIVPAIATTTAAVAGLVTLEVVKYLCFSGTPPPSLDCCLAVESRNNYVNLSLPSVLSVHPGPCESKRLPNGLSFTPWDRWVMQLPSKSTTLREFIQLIKAKWGLNVSLITQHQRCIYMTFVPTFQLKLPKP